MALQQPLRKAVTCHGCQRWFIRSFFAAASGQAFQSTTPISTQRRHLSRDNRLFDRSRMPSRAVSIGEDFALNDINATVEKMSGDSKEHIQEQPIEDQPIEESVAEDSSVEEHIAQEHVPWYLQVQQPALEQSDYNPVAARQRIPDLPEHPPSLLQPILEHVSVELGMDDLTILDLRSLDPPPALGANLLMIVGTARSEKHLHVSADRLCRWLRTTYKLRPYADGLLGRNELKLKMRRKAKRSRLLSAVGAKATADSEIDDGIRTGWVCVNVGRVEGGELPKSEEEVRREGMVVGFGSRTMGSNIVVQMMTEEKRGEIDLESLWGEVLDRATKSKARLNDAPGDGLPSQAESQRMSVLQEPDSPSGSSRSDSDMMTLHPAAHDLPSDGVQLRA